MKSKGRYQKESRKIYRKNQKIKERLEKEEEKEQVTVLSLIPRHKFGEVNISKDGNGV